MKSYLYWITLSAVGLAAGVGTAIVVGASLGKIVGMALITPILTAVVGAVFGSAQWLPLHQRSRVPALAWITATTLGLGAGLAAGVVLVEQVGTLLNGSRPHLLQLGPGTRALSLATVGLVSGLLLGLAQYFAFRRMHVAVARWPLASGAALSLAFAGASLLLDLLVRIPFASPAGFAVFLLTAGALYGSMTSRALRSAT
jgi:hypothetical protein